MKNTDFEIAKNNFQRANDLLARLRRDRAPRCRSRAIWVDCDGKFRLGRSMDMIRLIEATGESRA